MFQGVVDNDTLSVTLAEDTATVRNVHVAENGAQVLHTNTLNTITNEDGSVDRRSSANNALLKDASVGWTSQNVAGIYTLPSSDYPNIAYAWLELDEDGTSLTVSVDDVDKNHSIEDHEVVLQPGFWQIQQNGQLLIRSYRQNQPLTGESEICTPQTFDPTYVDNCVLYHEQTMDLHQLKDDHYYVAQMERFYIDSFALLYDQNITEHVLEKATLTNRVWQKVDTRPYGIAVP